MDNITAFDLAKIVAKELVSGDTKYYHDYDGAWVKFKEGEDPVKMGYYEINLIMYDILVKMYPSIKEYSVLEKDFSGKIKFMPEKADLINFIRELEYTVNTFSDIDQKERPELYEEAKDKRRTIEDEALPEYYNYTEMDIAKEVYEVLKNDEAEYEYSSLVWRRNGIPIGNDELAWIIHNKIAGTEIPKHIDVKFCDESMDAIHKIILMIQPLFTLDRKNLL